MQQEREKEEEGGVRVAQVLLFSLVPGVHEPVKSPVCQTVTW